MMGELYVETDTIVDRGIVYYVGDLSSQVTYSTWLFFEDATEPMAREGHVKDE